MNNVSLMGRLTRDPELRYTPNGAAVCRFNVAVDRRLSKERRQDAERNNQPTADFISCTAWNKTAELIANYFHKGDRIALTGRIQTGRYEDKDGKTVYTTDVIAETIDFVETANSSSQGQSAMQRPPVNSAYDQAQTQASREGSFRNFGSDSEDNEGFYHINNEDIPF
ncbi:single-stranded DNA-binding protein [Peptoniphilus equinus]|uniref:Single-stranded DNA-binding protein n=1 Tax=Peptoniphilus equinus TaxID=3016343 RepID=A0ABY7QTY7_9FIRM|nr:single-stranded DNA-binding protein [Peptoniphilus equinus]WBW50237.1 single-stranded DNA-binding protein [Peptoniphilus equinus]